jgi:hypothetical protein
MAKEQVLGFKPAPRLEQIDDEYFEQCKTASIALNHAMIPASRRESQAEWNFSGEQVITELRPQPPPAPA